MEFRTLLKKIIWLLDWSWVIAFALPFIYLLGNTAFFNKDDNFSQFTPVFSYAYNAILRGEFPWMHSGELGVRLAESPYYAIFSPILFASFLITHFFQLEPYWIINIWSLTYFALINLLLLKFCKQFSIPKHMKGALILCAGIASYMGQFSVNWYYVLPSLFLVIAKIYYWQYLLLHGDSTKKNDALLLVATFLAIYGGNPQLYLYVQVVEFLFLAPLLTKKIVFIYLRNQVVGAAILAPFLYCQYEYWGSSWRTIYNNNTIKLGHFLKLGIFKVHQYEGQSIWLIACIFYVAYSFIRTKKDSHHQPFARSLAITSILLLGLSALNLLELLGQKNPIAQLLTTPNKWWFFGGVTSVFAISLWSKFWNQRAQIIFASFVLVTSGIYLFHYSDKAAHLWGDLNYQGANTSIELIEGKVDKNSRIFQLSNFRNIERDPSSHLILNTWLAGDFKGLVFAKSYDTVQAGENQHQELSKYFDNQNLTLKQYQDLGISALWVNKNEYPKSLFNLNEFYLAHEDQRHYLLKLKIPGRIVSCNNSNCQAEIDFYPNKIQIHINHFSSDDVAEVKIAPLKNFHILADGNPISFYVCGENWLCFKPKEGIERYEIQYRDSQFLIWLIFSYIFFCISLAYIYISSLKNSNSPSLR